MEVGFAIVVKWAPDTVLNGTQRLKFPGTNSPWASFSPMRIPRWLIRTTEAVAALVGAYLLYRVFQKHDLNEIMEAIGELPAKNILACALFSAGSYACLTVSEYLSLRYARANRLSFGRMAVVTFASLGIGHSVGLSAVSSGAVRYRMYSRSGLDGEAVAKIM